MGGWIEGPVADCEAIHMTIILDKHQVPEKGTFEIRQSITILVSVEEARRKVNSWVLQEVSYMMGAEEPTLVVGEKAVWRVPVILTAPHVGHVGMAGTVDVDVQTGDMDDLPARKEQLLQSARELAAKMPAYVPRSKLDVPTEYIARNIQPVHIEPQKSPREIINDTRQRQSL